MYTVYHGRCREGAKGTGNAWKVVVANSGTGNNARWRRQARYTPTPNLFSVYRYT